MPLAGKGMLLTSMDIDPSDEAEFNRWYDREHLEERVAIDGFLEARRYVAHSGVALRAMPDTRVPPKYLCLYSTAELNVLDSPAYRKALANPTDWSSKTMARFKNMIRSVARITVSRGKGRGAVLGIVRLRPAAGAIDALRAGLRDALDPTGLDAIISMHLIEGDPALSGPPHTDASAAKPGAGDWFVLIDGTDVDAVSQVIAARFAGSPALKTDVISRGVYHLMWDLARSDILAV
jgi:hypothetical protein